MGLRWEHLTGESVTLSSCSTIFHGIRGCTLCATKSDAAETFKQFLSDTRADGVPSQLVTVRSDGGGEFCGGKFGDLYRSRCIKQQFTTADSPQFNGVAAMVGRIQARELLPGAQSPATESLWAEASHWACNALNRTATSADPANNSPYEMWYGNPLPVVLLPFLKPGYCNLKRKNTRLSRKRRRVFTWALRLTAPETPYEC